MDSQTQSWIALAIVGLTLAIFGWRIYQRRKAGAEPCCGGRCGCSKPAPKPVRKQSGA